MTELCNAFALIGAGFFVGMLVTAAGLLSDKKQARHRKN